MGEFNKNFHGLFSYEGGDGIEETVDAYYNCRLEVDFSDEFPAETAVYMIEVAYDTCVISLYTYQPDEENNEPDLMKCFKIVLED